MPLITQNRQRQVGIRQRWLISLCYSIQKSLLRLNIRVNWTFTCQIFLTRKLASATSALVQPNAGKYVLRILFSKISQNMSLYMNLKISKYAQLMSKLSKLQQICFSKTTRKQIMYSWLVPRPAQPYMYSLNTTKHQAEEFLLQPMRSVFCVYCIAGSAL